MIAAVTLHVAGYQLCLAGQTLKVSFGSSLPPWVIAETGNGILIDIMREALEPAGYDIIPVYVPYNRRLIAYKKGKVDVVCDVNSRTLKGLPLEGYLAADVYSYDNICVALKKRGHRIIKVSDLAGFGVVSWQGAIETIGGEYAEMAKKNVNYMELASQVLQVEMLFRGRPVVIQLDRKIFHYYRKKLAEKGKIDTSQSVDIFPLPGKNVCGFLFRDKDAQVSFTKRFSKLKESGRVDEIINKYTE